MADYQRRIVDSELATHLDATGAVLIEGPKACGKTETARTLAASEVLLDVDQTAREAAAVDPALILGGATPRLIDEWQLEPEIWNHVRRTIDERRKPGQFILAGSALPPDDVTRHTGAGRITRLRMRPMSLFELSHSTGDVSLARLLAGVPPRAADPGLTIPRLASIVAVGGWPQSLHRTEAQALQANRDYLAEIQRVDVGRVAGPRRDVARVGRLIRSLARNVGTAAPDAKLAAESGLASRPLDAQTVRDYLDALERLIILEDQPAWAPHLRSRSRLLVSAKHHFVDPSLAIAAVKATPASLLRDLQFFGFLFESMVLRDLRIYSQPLAGQVLHYREASGLEVDAIVETPEAWAAFEVKLGVKQIDEAAANLRRFADRIDTTKVGEPAALAVITAAGYGYTRDDGVAVIPIAALGP